MKLIVQIPCLNEEQTLPMTFNDIPKQIPGIGTVEILIINDGSTDRTVEVARELGVNHIVSFDQTKGLAKAFAAGIDACLKLGADIIVNTDGDNQYCGQDIPTLIKPILDKKAEIVIGDRQVETIAHFSYLKKKLQKLGSFVVRQLSSTEATDTTSGFRAYTRKSAMKMNIVSDYTYTLETIIQAGRNNIKIASVPIRTNRKLRESRLLTSMSKYIRKSLVTMIRTFALYKPLRFFTFIASLFTGAGVIIGVRFLLLVYVIEQDAGRTHLPSIILGTCLIVIGVLIFVMGVLADILGHTRKLNEEILYRIRKMEYGEGLRDVKDSAKF